jgi:hypothetical protein
MAAITIHRDAGRSEDTESPLSGAAEAKARVFKELPPVETTHTELVRLTWTRRVLEEALAKTKDGRPRTIRIEEQDDLLWFVLDPPLPKDAVPWYHLPVQDARRYGLFSTNTKMACPTWDLPAGSEYMGGTCPGATAGQSVVPERARNASRQLPIVGTASLQRSVCQTCYAVGGRYQSPSVQAAEIVRARWSREMLARHPEKFVEIVADAALRAVAKFPMQLGIKPIRVHSAGDFFSEDYARAWIRVMNEVWRRDPLVRAWAPTRVWAAGPRARSWIEFWRAAYGVGTRRDVPRIEHPDRFLVRPSAYHVGDPAFESGTLWPVAGSTVLLDNDSKGSNPSPLAKRPNDTRYDWDCHAYLVSGDDKAHSCANALNPEQAARGLRPGERPGPCRSCWVHRDMSVVYTAH